MVATINTSPSAPYRARAAMGDKAQSDKAEFRRKYDSCQYR